MAKRKLKKKALKAKKEEPKTIPEEPVKPVEKPAKKTRKKRHEEEKPEVINYETSGGMRKKYFIVLEEETYQSFSLGAYRRQEYTPVLMNQIVKIATGADIKFSKKEVESWLDGKTFDDGTDSKETDAKISRPYDPSSKPYNRIRRRFTCTLEEKVVENFRKSVKTNLYGCYLVNHLIRENLKGNLKLTWTAKDQADAAKWPFAGNHEPVEHGGELIPFDLGEPAAIPTHEWPSVLAEQRLAKEKEEASKPKRRRTLACPYPGCDGRAIKKVRAEDKTDIYYECNKCKKTFTRGAKKDKVPEEEE